VSGKFEITACGRESVCSAQKKIVNRGRQVLNQIVIVFACSILQAFVSTFLSLLFALPIAHFFYRFHFFGKTLFIALASMLCIMPTKLVVLCINLFYGASGFTGIILAHLMLNVPFTLYIINSTYEKLDTTLIWLAADSGASSWRCYKDIIFPLIRPTVISIALLLFLLHFASFSIPLLLGGDLHHNTPEIMMYKMHSEGNGVLALIFWIVRLAVIIPLFLTHNKFSTQKAKVSSIPNPIPKANYSPFSHSVWWLVYCAFVVIMILGPLVALVARSCDAKVFAFFSSIFSFVTDPVLGVAIYRVIVNSLLLAIVSGIGSVLISFLICTIEFKVKNRVGQTIVSLLTVVAFFIGTIGVGIIFAYLSYGKFISSFFIGVLCHIILNYAFAYRIIRAQMVLYHPDIHRSAQTFGATFKKAIWTVTLPFVLPSLLRAFCVSFGLSLTEVGAGTVLQGKIGLTMPMAIRMYRKCGNQESVIGLSLILLVLVLFVTYLFSYKK